MAVQCGHVYHLRWAVASKGKLLVPTYVDAKGRVRYFIINTNRTQFQERQPENAALVFPLKKADYPAFLTNDCWLCCDECVGGPTAEEVLKTKNCHRGPLGAPLVSAVREAVNKSRLLSDADKAAILDQWPA